jgi:hypothetical protein
MKIKKNYEKKLPVDRKQGAASHFQLFIFTRNTGNFVLIHKKQETQREKLTEDLHPITLFRSTPVPLFTFHQIQPSATVPYCN